jgi:hypothetical protein
MQECLPQGFTAIGQIAGRLQFGHVDEETGLWTPYGSNHNDPQYSWGMIAAQCIGLKNPAYAVNAMYLEYANVASPSSTVAPPTVTRATGLSYYNGLAYTPDRDFLRVPLTNPPGLDIQPGYEPYFTAGISGNLLHFFAMSNGSLGVLGKTFSSGVNSLVYGAALVATPVYADRSQDVILAIGYLPISQQTIKPPSSQAGVQWDVFFA